MAANYEPQEERWYMRDKERLGGEKEVSMPAIMTNITDAEKHMINDEAGHALACAGIALAKLAYNWMADHYRSLFNPVIFMGRDDG